ncbi:MAG: hypothetical protein VYE77_05090 [Planctomycetota bacterium]|nr:hypothetical protein [Planctomycetota bacterium]
MRILAPVLTLFAATAAATAQSSSDTLIKKDGSNLRGIEVLTFKLNEVKIKRGDKESDVPVHQVVAIEWGNVPDAFQAANAAMKRGDFAVAAEQFGDAANAASRVLVKTDARFLQAKAAVAAAASDPNAATSAVGTLQAWVTEFPEHWRLPEALLLLGRAQRMADLTAEAEQTLKDLSDRGGREGWGPIWSARAKYELAQTLMAQDNALEARGAFQSASAAADTAMSGAGADKAELRAIKINSKVGEGETLLQEKNYQNAYDYFRRMASGDDPALAAAGKAGEGQALFLGAGPDALDDVRRAQIALAEASILDAAAGEASAKANYFLGKCLLTLGREREGDSFQQRAEAYFRIVMRSYPNSSWAAAARQELAK